MFLVKLLGSFYDTLVYHVRRQIFRKKTMYSINEVKIYYKFNVFITQS